MGDEKAGGGVHGRMERFIFLHALESYDQAFVHKF